MLNPSNPEPAQSAKIMRDCSMSRSVVPLRDDDGTFAYGSMWKSETEKAIKRLADKFNQSEAGSKFSLDVVDASELPGLMEKFGTSNL
jgi:hypothetical protein